MNKFGRTSSSNQSMPIQEAAHARIAGRGRTDVVVATAHIAAQAERRLNAIRRMLHRRMFGPIADERSHGPGDGNAVKLGKAHKRQLVFPKHR